MDQYTTATKQAQTENWFHGRGKLVYDPFRGEMKSKTTWWVVVELDESITDYYRWWANRHINPLRYCEADKYVAKPGGGREFTWPSLRDKREDLVVPAWGAHMSIVRGEEPRDELKHLWKKYDGQIVDFRYSNNLRFSGDTSNIDPAKHGVYWFVDAICDVGKKVRDEFRLPSNWKFHITVGRVRAGQDFKYVPPKKSVLL